MQNRPPLLRSVPQPQTGPRVMAPLPQIQPGESQDVYPLFLRSALVVALTLGFTTGTALLLATALGFAPGAWWVIHTQIHGQAQLLGWGGLFVMGVAYHVYPRFKGAQPPDKRMALVSYGLMVFALAARALGQPLTNAAARGVLVALAATAVAISAALFVLALARIARRAARRDMVDAFIGAAAVWLLAGALANAGAAWGLIANDLRLIPQAQNDPLIHVLLVGYLTQFTLGVALRTHPMFLGLRPPHAGLVRLAWGLLNGGLLLRLGAGWLGALAPAAALPHAGTLLEAAGIAAFVAALQPFRGGARLGALPGAYAGFGRYIRIAWGWLLLGVALDAVFATRALWGGGAAGYYEASAVRHALALGFLSLMIFGMAVRIVPMFGGVAVVAPRLLDWALPIFVAGVALRVTFQLLAPTWPDIARAMMALSGVLDLLGLALFAVSLWRTLNAAARMRRATL